LGAKVEAWRNASCVSWLRLDGKRACALDLELAAPGHRRKALRRAKGIRPLEDLPCGLRGVGACSGRRRVNEGEAGREAGLGPTQRA
jgi:hypothetical protein